jgi:hypothetical protein
VRELEIETCKAISSTLRPTAIPRAVGLFASEPHEGQGENASPMPADNRDRINYWRALAADAMTAANLATDVPTRNILLNIAIFYLRLAERDESPTTTDSASAPAVFTKHER